MVRGVLYDSREEFVILEMEQEQKKRERKRGSEKVEGIYVLGTFPIYLRKVY